VFVRSFGGSTETGIKRQTDWLRATLLMGDYLEVHVFA
jgi:hypothetical protein